MENPTQTTREPSHFAFAHPSQVVIPASVSPSLDTYVSNIKPKPCWRKWLSLHWNYVFAGALSLSLVVLLSPLLFHKERKMANLGAGAFTFLLMVPLWVTNAIPLAVTSFIPAFTGPMFGLLDSDIIVRNYLNDIIFLFVGGISVALSFEFSELHKRVALRVILLTGTSPKMLLLGIMLTTSVMSLFMNNTSVTTLMCPIVMALVDSLEKCVQEYLAQELEKDQLAGETEFIGSARNKRPEVLPGDVALDSKFSSSSPSSTPNNMQTKSEVESKTENQIKPEMEEQSVESIIDKRSALRERNVRIFLRDIKVMLLMGTAFSANLAGTGMITGTGTNLVLISEMDKNKVNQKNDGSKAEPTVLNWSGFAVPPMLCNLIFVYAFLLFWFMKRKQLIGKLRKRKSPKRFVVNREMQGVLSLYLRQSYTDLGKITLHEIQVICISALLVILWFFADIDKKHELGWVYYWKDTKPSLSTPAAFAAVLCFVIPRKPEFYGHIRRFEFREAKFETVLEWAYIQKHYPWGALMILSGGFAMAELIRESGLANEISLLLKGAGGMSPYLFLIIAMFITLLFTAVAENTAAVATLVPIFFKLSRKFGWHPMLLNFSAALVGSHAFVFPVSTLPNAIVYTAGEMKVLDMLIPGLFITFGTSVILYGFVVSWGHLFFNFSSYEFKGCMNDTILASGSCPKGGDFFEV